MTKILIVDDEPVQLRLTIEVAKRAGFDTLAASNGSEALSLLRTDSAIGAMVLDLVMPDLDGMGVTTQRSSCVIWEKATGKALCNMISWQDMRGATTARDFAV